MSQLAEDLAAFGVEADDLFTNYHLGGNDGVSLLDGDTFETLDGRRVRYPGINTLETAKASSAIPGYFTPEERNARKQLDIIYDRALQGGYNIADVSDELDTTGERYLGDLKNAEGRSFRNDLIYYGLADITDFASEEDSNRFLFGRVDAYFRESRGERNDWDVAAQQIKELKGENDYRFKTRATSEAQLQDYPEFYNPFEVQTRHRDRHIDNTPKSKLGTAVDLAKSTFAEGIYGAFDLFGEIYSISEQHGWADDEKARVQREIEALPNMKHLSAFDENGEWTLDGVASFTDFLVGNAIVSAPYLVTSMLAYAFAAPTGGTSLLVPAAIYAGDTYNEQKEHGIRRPYVAILSGVGQASLDAVGVKTLKPTSIFSEQGRKKMREEVAQKFYGNTDEISLKSADGMIARNVYRNLAVWSNEAKEELARSLGTVSGLQHFGTNIVKAAAGEGITEGLQETVGYISATPTENWDWEEYKKRIVTASIAGAGLGGTFGTVGAVTENVRIADAIAAQERGWVDDYSHALSTRKALLETYPELKGSIQLDDKGKPVLDDKGNELQVNSDLSHERIAEILDKGNLAEILGINEDGEILGETPLAEYAKTRRDFKEKQGRGAKVTDAISEFSLSGLFIGNTKHIFSGFNRDTKDRPVIDILAGLLKGNDMLSGADEFVSQQLIQAELDDIGLTEKQAIKFFNDKNIDDINKYVYDPKVVDFIKQLHEYAIEHDMEGELTKAYDESNISLEEDPRFKDKVEQIVSFNQKLMDRERRRGVRTDAEGPNLLAYQNRTTLNKRLLQKNRRRFIQHLVTKYELSPKKAEQYYDDLLELQDVNSFTDLSNPDATLNPLARTEDNSELAELDAELKKDGDIQDLYSNNIFYNTVADSGAVANNIVNNRVYGKDGKNISYLLDLAVKNDEITEAQRDVLADKIQEHREIKAGQYGRINNPYWKVAQRNIVTFTALSALPFAALASVVEFALTTQQLNGNQIHNQVRVAAKSGAYEVYNWMENFNRAEPNETPLAKELRRLGFTHEKQGVSRRYDVSVGHVNQIWMDAFFKLVGLKGITDMTRAVRLGAAVDAMRNWSMEIATDKMVDGKYDPNAPLSRGGIESLTYLHELGVDTDFLARWNAEAEFRTPENLEYFQQQIAVGSVNFVNQAVALPNKANRPKFYNDPRLGFFFQFQGYISTFTANILPRLLRDSFGKGSLPGARASGFATMATMMALAFFTQYLRDLIKFGEPSPYLEDWEYLQRAIYASGLLGVTERPIDFAFPLYDQDRTGVLDALEHLAEDAAPAVSYVGKVGQAITDPTARNVLGAAPGGALLKTTTTEGSLLSTALEKVIK